MPQVSADANRWRKEAARWAVAFASLELVGRDFHVDVLVAERPYSLNASSIVPSGP
jgi:hypothetical protein